MDTVVNEDTDPAYIEEYNEYLDEINGPDWWIAQDGSASKLSDHGKLLYGDPNHDRQNTLPKGI